MARACFTAPSTWSSQGDFAKYFSTGNVRPGMRKIGAAPPKKLENFSAFSVADVTTSRRSRRRDNTPFRSPNSTSVCNDRSCASSMITTLYFSRSGSRSDSLSSTPSVMYLIWVLSDVTSSNLIA